jgi:hypothetical protein
VLLQQLRLLSQHLHLLSQPLHLLSQVAPRPGELVVIAVAVSPIHGERLGLQPPKSLSDGESTTARGSSPRWKSEEERGAKEWKGRRRGGGETVSVAGERQSKEGDRVIGVSVRYSLLSIRVHRRSQFLTVN